MVMFHFDLDEDTKNKVSLTDDSIPRNFIVYLYKTLLKMQSNDPKVRPTAGQILQNRNHFLVDNYLNINSFDIKMFIMEHPHWSKYHQQSTYAEESHDKVYVPMLHFYVLFDGHVVLYNFKCKYTRSAASTV
ncbi:unnamed protein product, partial [Oppiella nova]